MKQVIKLGTVLAICVTIINLYVMNKFVDTKHTPISPNETFKTLTLTGEEEETIQVTLPIYNSKPNSGNMCHPDNSNGTGLDLVTSH